MESLNPEFALYDSKNKCARTDIVFFTISEVGTRGVTLLKASTDTLFWDQLWGGRNLYFGWRLLSLKLAGPSLSQQI